MSGGSDLRGIASLKGLRCRRSTRNDSTSNTGSVARLSYRHRWFIAETEPSGKMGALLARINSCEQSGESLKYGLHVAFPGP